MNIKISSTQIDVEKSTQWVCRNDSGCASIFIGRVRPTANGREVKYLEFEAYDKMAVSELSRIVRTAKKRWKIDLALVHHRTGRVSAGEVPVVVAVSAKHRKEAIEACHYIIDTLKAKAPIWKKEVYDNGSEWVSAHP